MLMRSKGKVRREELEMVKKKKAKKKKWGGLEEYSGRGKGETGAPGDVKVNYHITGHFVLLIFKSSCTFGWKTVAKNNVEAGL